MPVLEAFTNARGNRLRHIIHISTAMAFLLYGWDAGVIGGILPTPQFQSEIGHLTVNTTTFIAAAILLGDVVGCTIVSPFTWTIGRRRCLIYAASVALIGVILQSTAYSPAQMIVGRFVLGLGNGVISAVVPIFVQESSVGAESRRSLGVLVTLGYGITGIAISNWVDYAVYKSGTRSAWRAPIAIQAFFLINSLVLLLFCVPETPRWLYGQDRISEADEVLCRLYDKQLSDPIVQKQREEIIASVKLEKEEAQNKLSFSGLFFDKSETKIARRIWLSWIVTFGAPLYGGSLIIFYSSSIFAHLGLDTDRVTILTASLNTATPFGMLFAAWLLPTFGRRPLLIWGGLAQLLAMVAFTILSNLGSKTTDSMNWGAVATLFLYQIINGATWRYRVVWLPYLYAVEIVPLNYRGQVNSIAMAAFWTLAFIEVYAGPIALADPHVGSRIFIWFCLGGGLVLGTCVFYAKETRGLSLEQIDLLWASEEYIEKNTQIINIPNTRTSQQDGSTSSNLDEKA